VANIGHLIDDYDVAYDDERRRCRRRRRRLRRVRDDD